MAYCRISANTLVDLARAADYNGASQPGEWVLLQVFLNESHCVVRVNGTTVAESREMGRPRSGNISL